MQNCFVISLSTKYTTINIPLKVKVSGCMGNTQYAINLHFLLAQRNLNLVTKKKVAVCVHTAA